MHLALITSLFTAATTMRRTAKSAFSPAFQTEFDIFSSKITLVGRGVKATDDGIEFGAGRPLSTKRENVKILDQLRK